MIHDHSAFEATAAEGNDRAARYSDLFGAQPDHATDWAPCPVCATMAIVRNAKPEVMDHLASAARELLEAAALLIEEAGSVVGAPSGGSSSQGETPANVRRIDGS